MALHIHIGRPRKTRDRAMVRRVRDVEAWFQLEIQYPTDTMKRWDKLGTYKTRQEAGREAEAQRRMGLNVRVTEVSNSYDKARDRARKARDCSCGGTGDLKAKDAEELSYEDVTQIGPWLVAYSPRSRQWEAKSKEGTYVKSSQREILEFVRNYPDGKVGL